MDFKTHLERSFQLTLENVGPLILMTLVMVLVSAVSLGLMLPVMMVGYTRSILRMVQEKRAVEISDLFSDMKQFLPLLGFAIAAFLLVAIGFALLFLPGIAAIILIAFGCLYMFPLIVHRNLGVIDAVKASWSIVTGSKIGDHIVVLLIILILNAIGSSVFFGVLLTQPFATIFLVLAYLEQEGGQAKQVTSAQQ